MDEKQTAVTPAQPPKPALMTQPKPKKVYAIDGRDRLLLVLSVLLGALSVDLCVTVWRGTPALGVTFLVLCWEGVLLWYARRGGRLWTVENRILTLAVLLLAAVFTLGTNRWFYLLNLLALPLLMVVQMFSLFGDVRCPWRRPLMLLERAGLLLDGLFVKCAAALPALRGTRGALGKRFWYVVAGLVVAVLMVLVLLPLLVTADALFNHLVGEAIRVLYERFGDMAVRLIFGALIAPFLFGLLYALRRPERAKTAFETWKLPIADPAMAVTVLAVLDTVYLLFVAVQLRGLFGGRDYMERVGISFAEYARSGFFQLVWVSAINLVVVLLCIQLTGRAGKLWAAVRCQCTLLVALSGLMLASAAARMTLYVGAYGLSFKRFLTYWGMVMLSVFFVAALLKIWRRDFAFFPVLFAAGIAGWLALNLCHVDAIVARYNVENYLAGNLAAVDVEYLAMSSYDALTYLERLPGDTQVYPLYPNAAWDDEGSGDTSYPSYDLSMLIQDRRAAAAADAASWRTWTVSAQRATKEIRSEEDVGGI